MMSVLSSWNFWAHSQQSPAEVTALLLGPAKVLKFMNALWVQCCLYGNDACASAPTWHKSLILVHLIAAVRLQGGMLH